MAKIKYVIVQAGGRGSRMEHLTRNKPKALVPVGNQPMLLRLFKTFSGCKFIVIGDWKADVLERYLRVFAAEDWQLARSTGKRGTCAGVSGALSLVPEGSPFVLVWSDLVLPTDFDVGDVEGNAIGLSADFPLPLEMGKRCVRRRAEHRARCCRAVCLCGQGCFGRG